MKIRNAEIKDIPRIMVMLREFSDFYGSSVPIFPKPEEASEIIRNIVENHVFLVAEVDMPPKMSRMAGTELVGLIAGFGMNHFLNPSIRILAECFWWVDDAHRNTTAGGRLLAEFLKRGKLDYTWITMSLIEDRSPVTAPSLLERIGFTRKETAFLLEV